MLGGCTEWYSSYSVGATIFITLYVLGTYEVGIDVASLRDSKPIIL